MPSTSPHIWNFSLPQLLLPCFVKNRLDILVKHYYLKPSALHYYHVFPSEVCSEYPIIRVYLDLEIVMFDKLPCILTFWLVFLHKLSAAAILPSLSDEKAIIWAPSLGDQTPMIQSLQNISRRWWNLSAWLKRRNRRFFKSRLSILTDNDGRISWFLDTWWILMLGIHFHHPFFFIPP